MMLFQHDAFQHDVFQRDVSQRDVSQRDALQAKIFSYLARYNLDLQDVR